MLVCGDTYHWGINLGSNLAIAVNYTEPDWVPPPPYSPCDPKKYGECPASPLRYSDVQIESSRQFEVDLCFLTPEVTTTSPPRSRKKPGKRPKNSANPASSLVPSLSSMGVCRSSRLNGPGPPKGGALEASEQEVLDTDSMVSVSPTSVGMHSRQQTCGEVTLGSDGEEPLSRTQMTDDWSCGIFTIWPSESLLRPSVTQIQDPVELRARYIEVLVHPLSNHIVKNESQSR